MTSSPAKRGARKYVFLGCEDPQKQTSGIYRVDYDRGITEVTLEKAINKSNVFRMHVEDEGGIIFRTPRTISAVQDRLLIFCRKEAHLLNLSNMETEPVPLIAMLNKVSFFPEVSDEERKKIVDDLTLLFSDRESLQVSYAHNGTLHFLSGHYTDGSHLRKKPGFLLVGSSLDDLVLQSNFKPTSNIVAVQGKNSSHLLVPEKNRLLILPQKENIEKPEERVSLNGDISLAAQRGDILICMDVQGGYLVRRQRNGPKIEFSVQPAVGSPYFSEDNTARTYLPSEAASVTVAKNKGKEYVLFGLDEGCLRVYELSGSQDQSSLGEDPSLKYVASLRLLSLADLVQDTGKDNFIRHLRTESEGTINFTLRNTYFRIALGDILQNAVNSTEQSAALSSIHRQQTFQESLPELYERYHFQQISVMPHRIKTMEIATLPIMEG